jgi:hypothetical protein
MEYPIRRVGRHGWCHAPRLVQPDQTVVREVKRDRRLQVLQLLAEGVGEAGKTLLVLFCCG